MVLVVEEHFCLSIGAEDQEEEEEEEEEGKWLTVSNWCRNSGHGKTRRPILDAVAAFFDVARASALPITRIEHFFVTESLNVPPDASMKARIAARDTFASLTRPVIATTWPASTPDPDAADDEDEDDDR